MKKTTERLFSLLMCLTLILTMFTSGAFASELEGETESGETSSETSGETSDESEEPSPDDLAAEVLASDPEAADYPVSEAPIYPQSDYTKVYPFSADVLFSGIFRSYSYYFQIEKYWETDYVYAQIEFSVSPLIEDVPASLTFSVNSTPIYSCKVDYAAGKTQVTYVEIPVALIKEGFNEFGITGYVRLFDDDGCLDDFSGANWVNVSKNSLLQAGYGVIDTADALNYYPYPFVSSMDASGSKCAVYVSDDASGDELAAALLMRADLADATASDDEIALKSLAGYESDTTAQRVVVANAAHLPQSLRGINAQSSFSLSSGAYVRELSDEQGTTLVVTSNDDKALYEGVAMLMDAARVSQEKRNYATVKLGAADTVLQNSTISALVASDYTIEGIVGSGLSYIGPFHREQDVFLPVSGGFVLAEGAKMVLNFRYSDNLDFNRSMITVYWGTIPVCSKKLERDKAGGDTLSFLMPSDVVGTSAGSIKIAFDLELEDLYCTKRADQMPWAYVSGDSTLYLPVGQSTNYSFETRPYPFQTLGLFNDACIVVPDKMSARELEVLGQIVSLQSAELSPYGKLSVVRASEFDAKGTDANLIFVGTYADNAAIRGVNDKLSFSFEDDGNKFKSNAQLLLSDDYADDIGVLQIINSPYFTDRAILVVSAANEDALSNIGSYLQTAANRGKLAGDAFLIDSKLDIKKFTFLSGKEQKNVSLHETLEQNKDAVAFTLVSTLAMLLLALAIVLIVLRARKQKKNGEE